MEAASSCPSCACTYQGHSSHRGTVVLCLFVIVFWCRGLNSGPGKYHRDTLLKRHFPGHLNLVPSRPLYHTGPSSSHREDAGASQRVLYSAPAACHPAGPIARPCSTGSQLSPKLRTPSSSNDETWKLLVSQTKWSCQRGLIPVNSLRATTPQPCVSMQPPCPSKFYDCSRLKSLLQSASASFEKPSSHVKVCEDMGAHTEVQMNHLSLSVLWELATDWSAEWLRWEQRYPMEKNMGNLDSGETTFPLWPE